ncbi:unnamed protein product [Vitrella brassicaformis CCMP3155]|uniref:Cyclin C-terminal domain-containing protein n=1 Tax=Vitrella brassicaformis (strain CCMP3155) TaxID=1169540 RepID=A0A0G4F9I1_VITBC|nr:unnamed protein product [Vitrella brassicaformis CCMP3155]|eukprot:CEM09021.1 unnamed protein product [Vitrella brassicaformis CCMP3155]
MKPFDPSNPEVYRRQMKWPQRRAVWVNQLVGRASRIGCGDTTVMRAVRLVSVADVPIQPTYTRLVGRAMADRSDCGLECLERLFTAAGMDTHGRLFSVAKYLMFLSMCDVDLAGCDVRLLAATAVYITRKANQDQIAGRIWSAALVAESSFSEAALESGIATLRMLRLLWRDTQTTKGLVTDAVDELFASPDRHSVASTHSYPHQQVSVWWMVLMWHICCRVWSWCWRRPSSEQPAVHNHPQQQQQQQDSNKDHPLAHFFVDDRCCIPDISTTLQLRATAPCFRKAFSSAQLRNRLDHSLSRDGDGINTQQLQLVQFDPSLGMGELMAAVWIAEEGGRWDETREVLQWASQYRYCTLPVILMADDIRTHASKTAYLSVARVLAQLMVAGRHVDFGDRSCLQIFRRANGEVRAIKDEPGFRLTVDPPLAAHHLYQQHRLEHDPPVESRINYLGAIGTWESDGLPCTDSSVWSFAKGMACWWRPSDGLLTQSPHSPVAGCTTTLSSRDGRVRCLVITDESHTFVAWIFILDNGNDNVRVWIVTTEAPVCVSGAFKDRFPVTTQLARVALGSDVAPYVFNGQVDDDSDDDDSSDGHGGG